MIHKKRKCEKMIYKMINNYRKRRYKIAKIYSIILRIVYTIDILPETQIGSNVEFVHNVATVNLPVRKVTMEQATTAEKAIKDYFPKTYQVYQDMMKARKRR